MLHRKGGIHRGSTVAVATPNLVADIKKAELKQAILERFVYRAKEASPQSRAEAKPRSPYWQPVDEEC